MLEDVGRALKSNPGGGDAAGSEVRWLGKGGYFDLIWAALLHDSMSFRRLIMPTIALHITTWRTEIQGDMY